VQWRCSGASARAVHHAGMWRQLQLLLLLATPALSGSEKSDEPSLKYLAPFNPDWQLAIELGHAVPTFQNLKYVRPTHSLPNCVLSWPVC